MATVVTCQHCIHWMQLRPGQLQYRRATDGLAGHCLNPGNIGKGLGVVNRTSTCDLAEGPDRGPTCQTCAFWEHLEDAESPNAGRCLSNKFAYGFPADENGREQLPSDGLMYADAADECAYLWTGPTFGCIHHQPRT